MLDTNVSLLLAGILFIGLIVFDLLLFRYRKEDDQNEAGISLTQDLMRRITEWREKRRKPTPDAGRAAESPKTTSAVAAQTHEVIMSQSPAADRPNVHVT